MALGLGTGAIVLLALSSDFFYQLRRYRKLFPHVTVKKYFVFQFSVKQQCLNLMQISKGYGQM